MVAEFKGSARAESKNQIDNGQPQILTQSITIIGFDFSFSHENSTS